VHLQLHVSYNVTTVLVIFLLPFAHAPTVFLYLTISYWHTRTGVKGRSENERTKVVSPFLYFQTLLINFYNPEMKQKHTKILHLADIFLTICY
jgi:hypothetical protein